MIGSSEDRRNYSYWPLVFAVSLQKLRSPAGMTLMLAIVASMVGKTKLACDHVTNKALQMLWNDIAYCDTTAGANSATSENRVRSSTISDVGTHPYSERDLILAYPGRRQGPKLLR